MSLGTEIALIKALGNGGGSGGGVLVVTDTDGTLDKTWQEIHDAGFSVLNYGIGIYTTNFFISNESGYRVVFSHAYSDKGNVYVIDRVYTASSASGYPELQL